MRRWVLVVGVVAVVVGLVAGSGSAAVKPQVFSLLEVSTDNSDQPLGDFTFDRPPVGGDRIAVRNQLYKWAGNKKGASAGHDQVMITFITGFGSDFSKKATALFTAQAYLQGGTIVIEGYGQLNPNGPSKYTFPIVGGTGKYAGANGYLNVRDLGDGNTNKTNLQFHITG